MHEFIIICTISFEILKRKKNLKKELLEWKLWYFSIERRNFSHKMMIFDFQKCNWWGNFANKLIKYESCLHSKHFAFCGLFWCGKFFCKYRNFVELFNERIEALNVKYWIKQNPRTLQQINLTHNNSLIGTHLNSQIGFNQKSVCV